MSVSLRIGVFFLFIFFLCCFRRISGFDKTTLCSHSAMAVCTKVVGGVCLSDDTKVRVAFYVSGNSDRLSLSFALNSFTQQQ